MAQAYINHVLQTSPNGVEREQINKLRTSCEFSDCDEDMLVKKADEMEQSYLSENRKRKSDNTNIGKENTKLQNIGNKFMCDFCDRIYAHQKTLNRHLKSHMLPVCHIKKKDQIRNTFTCDRCGVIYKHKRSLTRHRKTCSKSYQCEKCFKYFTKRSKLKQHKVQCENLKEHTSPSLEASKSKIHTCKHCGIPFEDYDDLFKHITENHPLNQTGGSEENASAQNITPSSVNKSGTDLKSDSKRFQFQKTALGNSVNQTSIIPHANEKYDLLQFLSNAKGDVEKNLLSRRRKYRNIKWYLNARVEMIRDIDGGDKEKADPHFRSKNYVSLVDESNDHNLNEAFQSIVRAMEEFINKGSNWILNKVICLEIHTLPYSPIAGSSFMELPKKIRLTQGIVNIRNDDQKCFLWSVLAALHPAPSNPNRVSHYEHHVNELNMNGISYPVSLTNKEKFEKQNLISINVFGYEDGEVFPLYLTKLGNGNREVDLLYLSDENKSHYCWIKNLDRFLGSITKFHTKRFYCRRCLHGFVRYDLLQAHRTYCTQFDFQRVTYPEEGKNDVLEFKDYHKQMRVPFVIYADFECFAKKMDTCQMNPKMSSTTHTTKFEPCGFSYVLVSSNEKYSKPAVIYRGDDVVKHFFEDMMKEEEYINEKLSDIEPLTMSDETEEQFQKAKNCYVCNRVFNDKLIKVRDHDHLGVNGDVNSTNYSNFRGAACQRCNLALQDPPFIPIYFHNLKNFDGHLLLSEAGKYKDKKLTCIPNNMEKYISFSLGKLRFLDTFQCMGSSLEKLVANLAADGPAHFKQFRKAFPDDDIAELLIQKNEYCYDYVDCSERFNETSLPSKEAFYNSLTKEHISDEKYEHAQTVWNTFSMKNLGEFHDLYVLTDTLLLADVFERFRDMTLENYKLDASHFYTSPGLAWQAALKMSGVSLDLITDPIIYGVIEKGLRGGTSSVMRKHSISNHEGLNDFNKFVESKHIMYLDANNLYGWAMSQPLPIGFFHFLSSEEIGKFNLMNKPADSKEGYILEVDLEYPPHLHDHHNCYPLAPEHLIIEDDILSPYSQKLWKTLNGEKKSRVKTGKLIPTLCDRKNYVVHYRNLQFYVDMGMKITKIHRILGFQQRAWLKSYIEFNAEKRKHAKNDFEKDFFKLMCNSVFGKCMENLRERMSLQLVHSKQKLNKYVAKPSFTRCQIFNEDLVGVQNRQTNLFLNKPIYGGQTILDLSKLLMYQFHYKVMKPMYDADITLLFTDTDSLCYEIKTTDVYADMWKIRHLLDTSNYPKNHPLYSDKNKKVPGYFKDECGSVPIKEAIMLRPKMYSILIKHKSKSENGEIVIREEEKKTAKGVSKSEIKQTLRHFMYKDCLFDENITINSMRCIRSKNHELYMDLIVKKGLCSFDDKRYWKNNIESYAFGHYKINEM